MVPLYSVKREATRPVPKALGEGLVVQPGIFTSNLATGGRLSVLDPLEDLEITEAATAIGEALITLFSKGFITEG